VLPALGEVLVFEKACLAQRIEEMLLQIARLDVSGPSSFGQDPCVRFGRYGKRGSLTRRATRAGRIARRRGAVQPDMNLEQARHNMVEQQIRTWEVLDPDVLELLHIVKREAGASLVSLVVTDNAKAAEILKDVLVVDPTKA